jgi:hypothetical protein
MAPTDSITIVKSFSYRGAAEEFSNTYHMDGATPTSAASWKTLADNIIAAEKLIFPSQCTIVRAMGHKAGTNVAVFFYDYAAHAASVAGTFAPAGGTVPAPGDAAAWVRWSTAAVTSRGKPIYLRSYFHNMMIGNTDATKDTFGATQKTALETYATAWITGFADGAPVTHHRAGPNGAAGLTPVLASTYITTRTLERRGKRPH